MTCVIAEPCIDVKDKGCIEECPVDCIYEGGARYPSTAPPAAARSPAAWATPSASR